jgi:hypothetical protein
MRYHFSGFTVQRFSTRQQKMTAQEGMEKCLCHRNGTSAEWPLLTMQL